MVRIWTIARTAWQETIRRQVFYIVLLVTLLVAAGTASQMALVRMVGAAGETGASEQLRASIVKASLAIWNFSSLFLAIFLGAVSVSSEVTRRTIVHVLCRPISRSSYLTGRWAGLLLFLWGFLLLGVIIASTLAFFLRVPWPLMATLAVADMFLRALFYSGVTLALGTFMAPVLAGCSSFLLFVLLPGFVHTGLGSPVWATRMLANAAYYLGPAQMPEDLLGNSFSTGLVNPQYGLYAAVLTENFLYAFAFFIVGCLIFNRRELQLR